MQRQVTGRVTSVMARPIEVVFGFMKNEERIQVWLVDEKYNRIEGTLKGMDECMNLVLDNAIEINVRHETNIQNRKIGRILLNGIKVACIQQLRGEAVI